MKFDIVPADRFISETRALIAPPYKPKFRSVAFSEIGKTGIPHSYLVKGLLVDREKSLIAGETQAGKSFMATHLGMCIARGVDFLGFKVRQPRGVIYIASESAGGVINLRVPAYKKHLNLSDDELPIRFIVQSPDLFNGSEQTKALIQDIKYYASKFDVPLGLVMVDTFSASTPGANENDVKDVSRILVHLDMIREECDAHVTVVHHMNAGGEKVRGHTSLVANCDTVISVKQTEERDRPEEGNGRPIRVMETVKQKDGVQGVIRKFVLKVIEVGKDEDGDPTTSCVCETPANLTETDLQTKWKEPGMYQLPKVTGIEMGTRALVNALKRIGREAPKAFADRAHGAEVVTLTDWIAEWRRLADDKEVSEETLTNRLKKQRGAVVDRFIKDNIIDKQGEYVWRTKRRIQGFDLPWRRQDNASAKASDDDKKDAQLFDQEKAPAGDPFADDLPFI